MTDDYLTGATYLIQAGAFRSCINTLFEEMDKTPEGMPANLACLPAYYLASHAMELLLKAALLKRGTSLKQLKGPDVRHNLKKLADLLSVHVIITDTTLRLIGALTQQHKQHFLRYGGPATLPHPQWLLEGLDELLQLCAVGRRA
jgi:hypothetical protein